MQGYNRRANLRQLVLRRDTATGLTLVGWEEDLPVGRFEHLTRNCKRAWVIARQGTITHVRARYPDKTLDELTYQVWYHTQLHQLHLLDGVLLEGNLMICESGLWFAEQ
ncbi:MAG: hypothetical protein GC149_02000 [Gammaproteobacteria bacterium]|nr:hypothetical protein [Gammaproteobacteria bacterium]